MVPGGRGTRRLAVFPPFLHFLRGMADGKFYTSSGVSAGMDMALGFVSDRFGRSRTEGIAEQLEYVWNDDCTRDVFARK